MGKESVRGVDDGGEKKSGSVVKIALLVLAAIVVSAVAGFFLSGPILDRFPELRNGFNPNAATQLFYSDGTLLATCDGGEDRKPVSIGIVPKDLQNAFVATEDVRFYKHFGIDPISMVRALWVDLKARSFVEGGSTITQQLVRNAFLTQNQNLVRKVEEQFLAVMMERRYSKSEILEMYMNQIYFGAGAYGVESAAETYFNKKVAQLDLAECAIIAGVTNNPTAYSPFINLENAKKRQSLVLDRMVEAGYITEAQADAARKEPLKLDKNNVKRNKTGSYFIEYVVQKLVDKYGAQRVYRSNMKVYTTLDSDMQLAAENAVSGTLPTYFKDENGLMQPQAALIAIDPQTGNIRAMVGGRGTDSFNRAVMAERQPGSAFKPFVYLAALESGISPNMQVEDRPTKFGDYEPRNYDYQFHGVVTIRQALVNSLNVIATRLCYNVGPDKVIDDAEKLGITTLVRDGAANDMNLSMALGGLTKGATLIDMATAYGTLANDGMRMKPIGILRIEDETGKVLEQYRPEGTQVADAQVVRVLDNMMQDVISYGTGANAQIGRPAAGKTGTTSDWKDAWFIGFTPNLCAAVWMGCDVPTPMRGVTGGDLPAVIWRKFMLKATAKLPVESFIAPPANFGSSQTLKDGVPLTSTVKTQDVTNEVLINGPDGTKTANTTDDNANGLPSASTGTDGVVNPAATAPVPAAGSNNNKSDKPR
ncbi:MAG: penicillin-binding protein 1A [Negativicutes bacterium]|jgi:penicillin-binding protein 1A